MRKEEKKLRIPPPFATPEQLRFSIEKLEQQQEIMDRTNSSTKSKEYSDDRIKKRKVQIPEAIRRYNEWIRNPSNVRRK